jgi:tRNA-modifying protein YgfZ
MTVPNEPAVALLESAAVRELPELALVRVQGDDRVSWLNGQITNDVRELRVGRSVHALAVNVRGKILSELWVTAREDELWLLSPASAQPELLESLEHYIIMEDVALVSWPEARVISLIGPRSPELQTQLAEPDGFAFAALGPDGPNGIAWVRSEPELSALRDRLTELAPLAHDGAFELARLRSGLPRFGTDYDVQRYPQEAGLKSSVSFQKGCYLGQEVVCTLESRGRLSRQLCAFRAEAELVAHTPIALGSGDVIGEITSSVWDAQLGASRALGYVKRVHAQPGAVLRAGTQALTLERIVGATEHAA